LTSRLEDIKFQKLQERFGQTEQQNQDSILDDIKFQKFQERLSLCPKGLGQWQQQQSMQSKEYLKRNKNSTCQYCGRLGYE